MAATLLLDRTPWDLAIDAAGNIALATEPYSQTQDAASAVRVFLGEAYLDTSLGVPYFTEVLGRFQPTQIFRARAQQQAIQETPGVIDATAILTANTDRTLTGQIQIKTTSGTQVAKI